MSVDLLLPYLSPGDGVIDLGAHVGEYTKAFAKAVGPTGRVVAVEPDPGSYAELQRRYADSPHVTAMEALVGSEAAASVPYWRATWDARHGSMWRPNVPDPRGTVDVPMVTLDHLAGLVPRLRLIKVDVQGAECHVLDGAHDTLAKDLVWYVEVWAMGLTHAGRSPAELAAQFQAHGYEMRDRTWADLVAAVGRHD